MKENLLAAIRGGLVVSCQAAAGLPLHGPTFMAAMARSVAPAGAVGIRANGVADVRAIRSVVTLPLIGLWKDGDTGVYITPTAGHARAVAEAGADVVAVDGTLRPRPDGRGFADTVAAVHELGRLVMADVATVDEGLAAEQAGADLVSTTLSGYTGGPVPTGPDLDLVAELAKRLAVPLVAEGRIASPEQARRALEAGAWSVVVGSAITAPQTITARFVDALAAR
ncbi:N-acetylmannosamine-6-phosphate 2-epimerase [Kutzneria viridogrisea]|uniref:Putative N-acetylmannosamine-6-phosphate 2-epimerase n=2 Tax=Kutzneria TaxID=43356 RepID=W5VY83_9PSEU|nr:N-acetylmannosamine-6-phosphate 2-epimerase [Kutzneria albida]AHH93527.1 Putative N-acetylmannosamine-6-phosphate 2-epimerase [Kutzneria albida DSM 43870]MBA8929087.1 N-acylglucosamine-6-phosphate 2-epimerase [Kutzneria viridogrisea]